MNECRDTNCFWPMPHYQHEPDGPVYALMTKPPLLPDDDTAVERLARADHDCLMPSACGVTGFWCANALLRREVGT